MSKKTLGVDGRGLEWHELGMDPNWFGWIGMNPNILSLYPKLIPTKWCSKILPSWPLAPRLLVAIIIIIAIIVTIMGTFCLSYAQNVVLTSDKKRAELRELGWGAANSGNAPNVNDFVQQIPSPNTQYPGLVVLCLWQDLYPSQRDLYQSRSSPMILLFLF